MLPPNWDFQDYPYLNSLYHTIATVLIPCMLLEFVSVFVDHPEVMFYYHEIPPVLHDRYPNDSSRGMSHMHGVDVDRDVIILWIVMRPSCSSPILFKDGTRYAEERERRRGFESYQPAKSHDLVHD